MFTIESRKTERELILILTGDLAMGTVNTARRALKSLDEKNATPVIVDMSKLEFIDSKGAAFLLELGKRSGSRKLALAGVPFMIRKVLSRLFIIEHFAVYKNVEEASRYIRLAMTQREIAQALSTA